MDCLIDNTLDRAGFDRQVLRINAASDPAERELEAIEQKLRGSKEFARDVRDAQAYLKNLRDNAKNGYTFAEKRRIVEMLVHRVTVGPKGECRIELRFHCGGVSSWLHRLTEERYCGVPRPPATDAEAKAGAEGLAVAAQNAGYRLDTTLRRFARPG